MIRMGIKSDPGGIIPRWGIALCIGFGACLLAGAAFAYSSSSRSYASATESATGTVTGLIEGRNRKIGEPPSFAPVVRFEVGGESREIQSSIYTRPSSYRVGDPVRIIYPPGKPEEARIDSWTEVWLVPLILGGVGSGFAFVGAVLAYANAKLGREVPLEVGSEG